jgi:hypothetical protein
MRRFLADGLEERVDLRPQAASHEAGEMRVRRIIVR